METYPRTQADFESRFATEAACRRYLADLELPPGIKAVKHGTLNPVVVAVTEPKPEEEVVAPVAAPVEDKKKGKGKK